MSISESLNKQASIIGLVNASIFFICSYEIIGNWSLSSLLSLLSFIVIMTLLQLAEKWKITYEMPKLNEEVKQIIHIYASRNDMSPELALIKAYIDSNNKALSEVFLSISRGSSVKRSLLKLNHLNNFNEIILRSLFQLAEVDVKLASQYAKKIAAFQKELDKLASRLHEKVRLISYRLKMLSVISSSCLALIAFISPLIKSLGILISSPSSFSSVIVSGNTVTNYFADPLSPSTLIALLLSINLTALSSRMLDPSQTLMNSLRSALTFSLTFALLHFIILIAT